MMTLNKKVHSLIQHEIQLENLLTPNMKILLINKSEKPCLTSFLVLNISLGFVCKASCNVHYNWQDCIYIALFCILYVIGYFISSQN